MGDEEAAHSADNGLQKNNDTTENLAFEPILNDDIENYLNQLRQQGISIQISSNVSLEQRQQLITKLQAPQCDEQLYSDYEKNMLSQQRQQHQRNSQVQPQRISQGKFQQVQSKRKRTKSLNSSNASESGEIFDQSYNNRFALLGDSDMSLDDDSNTNAFKDFSVTQLPNTTNNRNVNNAEKRSNRQNNQQQQNRSNKQTNIKEQGNRTRFCPPIVLYNVDIREMVMQFKVKFPNMDFKIVNITKSKSKLFVRDFDTYSGIMALLKEKKISSHSFTPEQNKQLSVMLRGLHYLTKADEIKNELDILCPNTIVNVQTFYTPYMRKNNIESSLFLVTLAPGKSLNNITNIKYLLYQTVSWEKPNNYTKEVQCKRCQRWGHIAKNCNHNYNCVKCDKTHNPGECSLPKSKEVEPYCINCKKWGHPANFRGCEVFLTFSKAKNLSNAKSATKSTSINSRVSENISYANVLRNNKFAGNNNKSALIKEFLHLAKELLAEEPVSVEQKIKNFLQNFKHMSIDDRKKECIEILSLIQNNNNE